MASVPRDQQEARQIFKLKIRLLGVTRPPVWRRLLVPADIRLDRLHEVIQAAMGWEDYHMHVFSDGAVEYGCHDPELGHRDERRATLDCLLEKAGDRIRYTYDFGDDWEHEIVLEDVLVADSDALYPICLTGKSACPPEDCGGVWGYGHLRAALADPADEQHQDMLEWLGLETGSEFDPTSFDIDEINESLVLCGACR